MLLVLKANEKLPALTCQYVGRELYHKRYDVVQVIGKTQTLQKIAWIFAKVSDMFDIQFQYASLIVRRVEDTEMSEKPTTSTRATTINRPVHILEHSAR